MIARFCVVLAVVPAMLAPQSARAACDAPYPIMTLLEDLVGAERLLRSGLDAGEPARAIERGLVCMDVPLPRVLAGRVFRTLGAGIASSGDLEGGSRWLRTAADLDPMFEFGLEDLPAEHIVRDLYAISRAPADPTATAGFGLVDGVVYLDGAPLSSPEARPDRYHLVQWEGDGQLSSQIIDGDVFPLELLVPGAKLALTDLDDDVVITQCFPGARRRSVLLFTGVAALSGSALLFGASIPSRHAFFESKSFDELQQHQLTVNRLTGASIAAGVLGSGLITASIAF